MNNHPKNKKMNMQRFISLNLFLVFLSIYLLTASGININQSDVSIARIEVAKSIIDKFDVTVPAGTGIRGNDGKEYSLFSIGSVLVALPFYRIGIITGIPPTNFITVINQIIGAATVVLIFSFSHSLGYSRRSSLYVAFIYGLCSMAWYYSKDPGDHALETFFILFSAYSMCQYHSLKKRSHLLISALLFGLACIMRPTSLLIIPPLFMLNYLLYRRESTYIQTLKAVMNDITLFFIVFSPFASLLLWYNYSRFGSIFETGYALMAKRLGLDFFIGSPFLTGFCGFLLSPSKGFFYYSPVAVLFFFSVKSFSKRHLEVTLCFVCIILSYLLFLSNNVYWHGDWAWGPRYIFVLTPFFIIPLAALFDSDFWLNKVFPKTLISSILAVSLVIQLTAVSVHPYKYFYHLYFYDKLRFSVATGEGVQPIIEPPLETYFEWRRSPILAQFNFIHEILLHLNSYHYKKLPKETPILDEIEADPRMNVFDFWWLYKYFVEKSYTGFFAAVFIFLIGIISAFRLWRGVLNEDNREK